jgi:hypothetical protein
MEEWIKKLLYGERPAVYSDIESEPKWYERPLETEGRYTFLPLKDTMEGSVFNERQWALPGLLAEAVNAFTAPRRSMTGLLQEPDAPNMALNMMGGGLLSSRAVPNATGSGGIDIGMFAGRNAKTADLEALRRFNELKQQGAPSSESYRETGWMKGAEGQPKFEISDDLAKVTKPNLSQADVTDGIARTNLGSLLDHPDLYKAYPELKDYSVYMRKPEGAAGSFSPDAQAFQIDPRVLDPNSPFYKPETAKNLLLHEAQHAVQRLENFESGGNPKFAKEVFSKQRELDLKQFDPDLEFTWKSGMSNLTFASKVDYAKRLDKIIQSDNIKPSTITRLSDWYLYADKIRSEYGPPPAKPGAQRDSWYRNAARYMKDQELKDPSVKSAYESMSEKDIKNMFKEADKALSTVRDDYRKYRETKGKYSEMKELSSEALYKRLAGEAEARLTETRSGLNPTERRARFPFKDLDVEYGQLLYPSLLD